MHLLRLTAVLMLAWAFSSPAWAGPDADRADRYLLGRVVHVHDGDTFAMVREDLELVVVRLYGIDAPEAGQPFGAKSARALKKMINKKLVLVEVMQKADRYGRLVGIVRLEDRDINREMVEQGLAWVEHRFCRRKRPCNGYWASVRRAQKDRRGLWAEQAMPPWEWRKK